MLNHYNEIFKTEEKFDINFTTFFLLKIYQYKNILEKCTNYKNSLILDIKNAIINTLFYNIVEDQKVLIEMNKNFFFKTNNSANNY